MFPFFVIESVFVKVFLIKAFKDKNYHIDKTGYVNDFLNGDLFSEKKVLFVLDENFSNKEVLSFLDITKHAVIITSKNNRKNAAFKTKFINSKKMLCIDCYPINRKSKESNLKTKKINFYQLMRFLIGRMMCLFINFSCLNLSIGDTQAGLKAFIKPKKFKKIKFKSKKFFFDAEIMIIFYLLKKKMKYIPVEYSIPKDSTIKIFEFKNFLYLYELLKVIIYYKLVSKKKYTTLV